METNESIKLKNNARKSNKLKSPKDFLNDEDLFNDVLDKKLKNKYSSYNEIVNPKFLKRFSSIEHFIKKFRKNYTAENQRIIENLPFKKSRDSFESVNKNLTFGWQNNEEKLNQNSSFQTIHDNTNNQLLAENKSYSRDNKIGFKSTKSIKMKALFEENDYGEIRQTRTLIKYQNVYDSFSDEEVLELAPKNSKYLLKPNSRFKKIWDYFMIFIIFYSSLLTPYILCFDDNKDEKWLFYNEFVFEIIYMIDIFLNFFVPFIDKNDNLVTNHYLIFQNYLLNYFLLDFICAIPFNLTHTILGTQLNYVKNIYNIFSFNSNSFILKWLLVLRLLKVMKYEFLEDLKFLQDFKLNRIFKSGVIFIYLSHISACIWIEIGKCNYRFDSNWIVINSFNELSNYDIYIASIYFNFVTIFTIGYGDILASNLIERLYNIFLLIFGVMLYTFALTNISSIFTSIDKNKEIFQKKLEIIEDISSDHYINFELYTAIKQFVTLQFKNNNEDRYILLDNLPSHVKNYLTTHMYKRLIKDLKFFKDQTFDFILFVLPFLKSHVLERNEILFSEGEVVDEMYLVISGVLAIQLGAQHDNLEIGLVNANSHFGELFLQTNEISSYVLKCKTNIAEILVLKKQDFIKIKSSFKINILQILRESYKTLEVIEKRRQQFLRLYHYENSVEGVKSIMRRLNIYLMIKGFDDYYYRDIDFIEANDYIIKNDFKTIILSLKTDANDKRKSRTSRLSRIANSNILSNEIINQSNENLLKRTFISKITENSLITDQILDNNKKCLREKDFLPIKNKRFSIQNKYPVDNNNIRRKSVQIPIMNKYLNQEEDIRSSTMNNKINNNTNSGNSKLLNANRKNINTQESQEGLCEKNMDLNKIMNSPKIKQKFKKISNKELLNSKMKLLNEETICKKNSKSEKEENANPDQLIEMKNTINKRVPLIKSELMTNKFINSEDVITVTPSKILNDPNVKKKVNLKDLKRSKTKIFENFKKKIFDGPEQIKEEIELNQKTSNLIRWTDKKMKTIKTNKKNFELIDLNTSKTTEDLLNKSKCDFENKQMHSKYKSMRELTHNTISNYFELLNIEKLKTINSLDGYMILFEKCFNILNPVQKEILIKSLKLNEKNEHLEIESQELEILSSKASVTLLPVLEVSKANLDITRSETVIIPPYKINLKSNKDILENRFEKDEEYLMLDDNYHDIKNVDNSIINAKGMI